MSLNIRQIEIFAAVMEHGSTTAAANHLNVSQPSVSKYLKMLEANSGVSLFMRHKNRLIPTSEAKALFEEVKQTYSGISHLESYINNLTNQVKYEISIGCMPLLSTGWFPQVVARFLEAHDYYSVSMPVNTTKTLSTLVASGRADLAICMNISDEIGVVKEPLLQIPVVCIFPKGDELEKHASISTSDLNGKDLITLATVEEWRSGKDRWRYVFENKFVEDKVKPKNVLSVSTSQLACEFVMAGSGVAIVDIFTALNYQDKGLAWRPFEIDYTFDIFLISRKDAFEHRFTQKFVANLKSQAIDRKRKIEQEISLFK